MATQKRIFEGAKTEMKISKGKNPKPYLHKIFNVTFTDGDFVTHHETNEGEHVTFRRPMGYTKIRSVFIFNTKRKNTLSVMVITLTPKYNNKGKLITENQKTIYCVNPITKKVWKRQRDGRNVSIQDNVPNGWELSQWKEAILEAVS